MPVLNPKKDNREGLFTCETRSAGTGELVKGGKRAGAAVETGVRIAGVGDGDLAQGSRVADGTRAPEAGAAVGRGDAHVAGAAVLTARPGTRVARVGVLTVLAHVHARAAETHDNHTVNNENRATHQGQDITFHCIHLKTS